MTQTPIPLPSPLEEELKRHREDLSDALSNSPLHLPADPAFVETLERVMVLSAFAARSFIQHPELLADLVRSGDLTRPCPPGAFLERLGGQLRGVQDEADLTARVRHFRKREMLRILWRGLSGASDLCQEMAELSDLADGCLEAVLSILYDWAVAVHGTPVDEKDRPQRLVVVGMGKLGARELNLSSDIDLIFAFPSAGECRGGGRPVTSEVFFTRLCRRLIQVIGTVTADGFVFRVDTNLRPFGGNGPLVMHFDAMESYYQIQGREWERYAWIKARVVAGDVEAGGRLMDRLRPFVYRRYLDYGVYEALREMKEAITAEVARKGLTGNVKLGPGGIREVEFFGQVFQLLRGGVVPSLQERSILKVLDILGDAGLLPQTVCRELAEAYRFLRSVEHRLQAVNDRQTHDLPDTDLERMRLAVGMGYPDWQAFYDDLSSRMAVVHGHFTGLLAPSGGNGHSGNGHQQALLGLWKGLSEAASAERLLEGLGYGDPKRALQLIDHLREDPATQSLSATGWRRLDQLVPILIEAVGKSPQATLALSRIMDLVRAIERRTPYLSLLLEKPAAIDHLVRFASASPMVISYLARHPVLLDELLDHRTLYTPPSKDQMAADIRARLATVAEDDLENQIECLCVFRQVNTLRVAAADVTGVLPLMRTSDHLTWLAEVILAAVCELAWRHLVARHGIPRSRLGGQALEKGFMVAAYGKLGGLELGYASDLDIVFFHAGEAEPTEGGPKPMDTRHFYARLGQRILHILTTPTRAGVLYETDMRLRPSGVSGPLVSHIEAFRAYELNEAWTWEHQALVRARSICGDAPLMRRFEAIRGEVLRLQRDRESLRRDVVEMRERMRRERHRPEPDTFDLKEGEGGIVDIEFLVQYLVLLESRQHPALTRWSDNVRQLQTLAECRIVSDTEAHLLKEAYLTYRSIAHRRSLQEISAQVSAKRFASLRHAVIAMWKRILED